MRCFKSLCYKLFGSSKAYQKPALVHQRKIQTSEIVQQLLGEQGMVRSSTIDILLDTILQKSLTPGQSQTMWTKVPLVSKEHSWQLGDGFNFIKNQIYAECSRVCVQSYNESSDGWDYEMLGQSLTRQRTNWLWKVPLRDHGPSDYPTAEFFLRV